MKLYQTSDGRVFAAEENVVIGVHLRHGKLYGYCTHCPPKTRRAALRRCVQKDGCTTCSRRLNILRVFNIARPAIRKIVDADYHWLRSVPCEA